MTQLGVLLRTVKRDYLLFLEKAKEMKLEREGQKELTAKTTTASRVLISFYPVRTYFYFV